MRVPAEPPKRAVMPARVADRWNPDGGASPNRGFVLANEMTWRHFHSRLREINRDWHAMTLSDDEDFAMQLHSIALMRTVERSQLREEVRLLVEQGNVGNYLIPV